MEERRGKLVARSPCSQVLQLELQGTPDGVGQGAAPEKRGPLTLCQLSQLQGSPRAAPAALQLQAVGSVSVGAGLSWGE